MGPGTGCQLFAREKILRNRPRGSMGPYFARWELWPSCWRFFLFQRHQGRL